MPKSRGGRLTEPVHPICHRTVHATFTNAKLARMGTDREAMLRNEDVSRFVRWIAAKPPDFNARTRRRK